MKKVVVISTSLRSGSNSHALAEQFAEGAKSAGNEVELISLKWKEIKFCIGCLSCQKTGACVFKDDVPAIMDSVLNADVVCWATPIYYYEMSGQMKTLIDRMNAISICLPRPPKARRIRPSAQRVAFRDGSTVMKNRRSKPIFSAAVSMIRGKSTGIPNSRRRLNWGRTFSLAHSASSA